MSSIAQYVNYPLPLAKRGAAADVHAPTGTDTAATVTYDAITGADHVVDAVYCGYDGAPTAGLLTISDGTGNTLLSLPITDDEPHVIPLIPPLMPPKAGDSLTITLAAAGAVHGQLTVRHRTQSP